MAFLQSHDGRKGVRLGNERLCPRGNGAIKYKRNESETLFDIREKKERRVATERENRPWDYLIFLTLPPLVIYSFHRQADVTH